MSNSRKSQTSELTDTYQNIRPGVVLLIMSWHGPWVSHHMIALFMAIEASVPCGTFTQTPGRIQKVDPLMGVPIEYP